VTAQPTDRAAQHAAVLDALCERIGYDVSDRGLLRRAVAHRSWCAEEGGEPSNERLEFLGDAVLGWVIADLAYRRFADLAEGRLTDLRKAVVNATALAEIAVSINLGDALLLGKGERSAGGASKPSILSDALEAVIGAVYIDGGVVAASGLIERLFTGPLTSAVQRVDRVDHKTALQERVAQLFDAAPVYVLSDSGPDHAKHFNATVMVLGRSIGSGDGPSKKTAEQRAAAEACAILDGEVTEAASRVADGPGDAMADA
jgi:ribonuclease III